MKLERKESQVVRILSEEDKQKQVRKNLLITNEDLRERKEKIINRQK